VTANRKPGPAVASSAAARPSTGNDGSGQREAWDVMSTQARGSGRKWRLAVLTSHPIQYQAPLFRALAEHPSIDLTVFFCSDHGAREYYDAGFRRMLKWDVPLTDGYDHRFLMNIAPAPSLSSPLGQINPSILYRLRRSEYDALLIHSYAKVSSLLGYLAARTRGIPILLRTESTLLRDRPWWVRVLKRAFLWALLKQTSACLYIGTRNREFFEHYGVGNGRLFPVPYAVESERLSAAPPEGRERVRRELGIDDDRLVILFCGKLIACKRPLDLVRALARAGLRRATLLIAGDGELRPQVESEARRLNVDVRPAGFVNQEQLPAFYGASDCLVLPSEYEPWGLVVNEAMACGLPIIASDKVGCAADLVRPRENGLIYRCGDMGALAEALHVVARDARRRRRWGRRSREIIGGCDYGADVEGIVAALEQVAA